MKEDLKQKVDELAAQSSIRKMTHEELRKFLISISWHLDFTTLGQIYEYLQDTEEEKEPD